MEPLSTSIVVNAAVDGLQDIDYLIHTERSWVNDTRRKRDVARTARPVQCTQGVYLHPPLLSFTGYGLFAVPSFNPSLAANPQRPALPKR